MIKRMGVFDEYGLESTARAVLGGQPDVDPLAMERVRARVEAKLFGRAAPARFGRYEIIDPIGHGGMGLVYSGYDPQLQRKTALKVLHPERNDDGRAHERMIREARALAKLDHPNVVKVHDVIVENWQVVVVMELLEGETLEQWQVRASPSCRDIVAAYAQAGDGLAAAHDVGVVHRDFKPSNAIISPDGCVRVVDFGLAHLTSEPELVARDGVELPHDLTAPGDVLGTLAYSAPEQLAGLAATHASDQFSFCVALHAAIEGTPPFTGGDRDARLASIQQGNVSRLADGRNIPPWLRAVVARGLSAKAGDRFASLRDVVHELRRTRGWRRWRSPVLATAALAAATLSTVALTHDPASSMCAGEAELVESAWNPAVRDQIGSAIQATGTPYAAVVHDLVLSTLERYATDWRARHQSACRTHQRGETSAVLYDRQISCLRRRLGELRGAASVLARIDARTVLNAMDVVSAISSASMCNDLERLQSDIAPPEAPATRAQVESIREQISSAEALARSGLSEDALAMLSEARTRATATPYPPVQVEASLAEGRIHIMHYDLERAIPVLTVARKMALEQHWLPAALEASARLLYADGQLNRNLERLELELEFLLPLSHGLRSDDLLRALLLNNAGAVYLAAGQRVQAADYFEKARAVLSSIEDANDSPISDAMSLELTSIDFNLALVTGDEQKRAKLLQGVLMKRRAVLGEQHRSTINALVAYAVYTSEPVAAIEALDQAASLFTTYHPSAGAPLAYVEMKRAFLASEHRETARAADLYRSAIAKWKAITKNDMDDYDVQRRLCSGELALLANEPRRAIEELLPVYHGRIERSNWRERAEGLRAAVGIGQAELKVHSQALASPYLNRAVREYEAVFMASEQDEYRRLQKRAHLLLAQMHPTPADVALPEPGASAPIPSAISSEAPAARIFRNEKQ